MTRKQVVRFTGSGPAWPASYVGFYSDSAATTPVTVYSDQIAGVTLASGKTGSSPVRRLRADNLGTVPPPALGTALYVDSSVTTLYARPETVTGVAVSGAAAVSVASFGPDGPVAQPDPSQSTGWTAGQIDVEALKVASAILTPTAVKTSAYTAAAGDLVPVDTTSGAVTITLPAAPADKTRVVVKHVIQGGTNVVTVACGGSDVFNKASGATSATLALLAQAVQLQYKASGGIWYVVGDDLPLPQLDGRFMQIPTIGTLGAQPAAATFGKGEYLATDDNSGQLYLSDGTVWRKGGAGVAQAATPALVAGPTVITATTPGAGTTSTTYIDLAGMGTPAFTGVVGKSYKIMAILQPGNVVSGHQTTVAICNAADNSIIREQGYIARSANDSFQVVLADIVVPGAVSYSAKVRLKTDSGGTAFVLAGATFRGVIWIEQVN